MREIGCGLQFASSRCEVGEVALQGVELLAFEAASKEVVDALGQHADVSTGSEGGELAGVDQRLHRRGLDAEEACDFVEGKDVCRVFV